MSHAFDHAVHIISFDLRSFPWNCIAFSSDLFPFRYKLSYDFSIVVQYLSFTSIAAEIDLTKFSLLHFHGTQTINFWNFFYFNFVFLFNFTYTLSINHSMCIPKLAAICLTKIDTITFAARTPTSSPSLPVSLSFSTPLLHPQWDLLAQHLDLERLLAELHLYHLRTVHLHLFYRGSAQELRHHHPDLVTYQHQQRQVLPEQ